MYIENLSAKLTSALLKQGTIADKDKEIYAYGFELLISVLINVLGMIILSFCMHLSISWFWFLCSFVPLRTTAGGYHANTHLHCTVITLCAFFCCLLCITYLPDAVWPIWISASTIVLAVVIVCIAPVESSNKPLDPKTKRTNRQWAITFALGISVVATLCVMLKLYFNWRIY